MKKFDIILCCVLLGLGCSQKVPYKDALARLRSAYFHLDYEDGYEQGKK